MAQMGRCRAVLGLALWLIAVGLLVGTAPQTVHYFACWRAMRTETALLEQQLAQMRAEVHALEAELRRVQTDLGRESLARQRGWLRKGEEPLRLNTN